MASASIYSHCNIPGPYPPHDNEGVYFWGVDICGTDFDVSDDGIMRMMAGR